MSVKITKDGRTIRDGADYHKFRMAKFDQQEGRCIRCTVYCDASLPPDAAFSFHVHHLGGRGMGGSKRDDVAAKTEGLCGACHRSEHNQ